MGRIAHFEIHADNPERAAKFLFGRRRLAEGGVTA
jgi:hypothetical protein